MSQQSIFNTKCRPFRVLRRLADEITAHNIDALQAFENGFYGDAAASFHLSAVAAREAQALAVRWFHGIPARASESPCSNTGLLAQFDRVTTVEGGQ